jgi:hypothetical protein
MPQLAAGASPADDKSRFMQHLREIHKFSYLAAPHTAGGELPLFAAVFMQRA